MADNDTKNSTSEPGALFAHHPFFAALSSDDVAAVTRGLRHVALPPSTVFVREGEPGDCVYLLVAGSVEIIKALGTADERSLGERGPGDVIGEMSLIDPAQPRSASVRAQTGAEALVITAQEFDQLLIQHPQLSLHLLRGLSQRLRLSENATIRDLQEKNRELQQAYQALKTAQQKLVEQEALARELAHAQRIQLQMLPTELPHLAGVDLGAAILAARSVGGDLYDAIRLDEERLALAIGDVSGKGIPAALYMALVASLLRAEARPDVAPETVVRRINRHLYERDMESMFVTLLYGELNLRTRSLRIVRAGHEHPLLWVGETATPLAVGGRSMPLGLVEEPLLDVWEITLPAAATLVMFTDGVTDAIDLDVNPFGKSRLLECVARNLHQSAQALCAAIVDAVLAHQDATPQFDDVTVLAVRVN